MYFPFFKRKKWEKRRRGQERRAAPLALPLGELARRSRD